MRNLMALYDRTCDIILVRMETAASDHTLGDDANVEELFEDRVVAAVGHAKQDAAYPLWVKSKQVQRTSRGPLCANSGHLRASVLDDRAHADDLNIQVQLPDRSDAIRMCKAAAKLGVSQLALIPDPPSLASLRWRVNRCGFSPLRQYGLQTRIENAPGQPFEGK